MTNHTVLVGNCQETSRVSLFNGIVLGRNEVYDASTLNCWPFSKSTDVRNGISLNLGNLCKGYPFKLYGHVFLTSEAAYLCGEFSADTAQNEAVQCKLASEPNAFVCKKVIKHRHLELVRTDWPEIRLQWMLYVVWQKCMGNRSFSDLLMSLPTDAVIIEDSTANHSNTSTVWGAKNKELRTARKNREKDLREHCKALKKKDLNALITVECGKINGIGHFVGENNMGKILKMCQIALQNGTNPPINYGLLRAKRICLFGHLLTFDGKEA